MRKNSVLLLLLTLLLTGCAGGEPEQTATAQPAAMPERTAEQAAEWTGLGGCFVMEFSDEQPDEYYAFTGDGGMAGICFENNPEYYLGADDGSGGLQVLSTKFRFDGDRLYCVGYVPQYGRYQLLVLTSGGELLCETELPESYNLVSGGDGRIYAVAKTAEGNDIYAIEPEEGALSCVLSVGSGEIINGNESAFLLCAPTDGIYRLDENGSTAPIIIWSECGIAAPGRCSDAVPDGGGYLLTFRLSTGPMNFDLIPVEPSEVKTRPVITLATIGVQGGLDALALSFSASHDYAVQVIDYTDNYKIPTEDAILRLNTEIISGRLPDMLCLGYLSPEVYIGKGLLANLSGYMDDELALEDIVISKALETNGGIYYLGNAFKIHCFAGLYSRFGEGHG